MTHEDFLVNLPAPSVGTASGTGGPVNLSRFHWFYLHPALPIRSRIKPLVLDIFCRAAREHAWQGLEEFWPKRQHLGFFGCGSRSAQAGSGLPDNSWVEVLRIRVWQPDELLATWFWTCTLRHNYVIGEGSPKAEQLRRVQERWLERPRRLARVLVLGNSHTNQLIQSMLCRFHAERIQFHNGAQLTLLYNSPLFYIDNDNIPGTIRRLLGVHTLAEFSVIVFHHLNGDWWAQKWAGYDHQCGSTIARRFGGPPSALTFAAQLQASSFRGTLLVDTAGLSDQYHVASADILCAAGEHFSRLAHIKTQCWDFLRRYMVDHRTKWACALDDVYHQCIPGPIDAVTDIWLAILWRVKTEAQAWRPRALMLRLDAVYASRSAAAPDGFEECINFWYRECGLPAELRSQLHSLRIWANAARHHDAARWRRD
ncbi:hypothetical protein EMIHUDRAFT_218702 [Emiliania huxleyi CCMP1516]|uniref:Uncharacterized protein n=2 Tax=Emiliania huxleyi TaxID=2903 RepID=A0A0D3I6T4_EMIH1|nr:hypothetical protein EMIHUDRAFT_218702 [Emiliania huxleyi CCMP1516]EOD06969.1 hypothetical protein EMIHUDRAFT_218702 [Emiliania huxleyi CCMP1516]|eukprot:XP_005759398.1 hypothetical protein EMIHUDRAFT_218702 [Emiliania huxleyi CCMP1516]